MKMKVDINTFSRVLPPMYILEESRLRRNLALIQSIAAEADIDIILAFQGVCAVEDVPDIQEYIHATTASSLYEARLAYEEFGSKGAHPSHLPIPTTRSGT